MESLPGSGIIFPMSKPLVIEVPHSLPRQEARRRLDGGFDHLQREFGDGGLARMEKSWSGDTMNFVAQVFGQSVHGRLEVLDQLVRAEVFVPPLLSLLAGPVKNRIRRDAQLLLASK